uniref:Uncharacterized protein n=1 Tax=Anopheles coluzzii TaxID=1518534 RepID=A0A8W7Q316_ANOCL
MAQQNTRRAWGSVPTIGIPSSYSRVGLTWKGYAEPYDSDHPSTETQSFGPDLGLGVVCLSVPRALQLSGDGEVVHITYSGSKRGTETDCKSADDSSASMVKAKKKGLFVSSL